jgi:hypothetical protein
MYVYIVSCQFVVLRQDFNVVSCQFESFDF